MHSAHERFHDNALYKSTFYVIYLLLVTVSNKLTWLAVWLSGNALASIDVVALRQTRLVLGWVTR